MLLITANDAFCSLIGLNNLNLSNNFKETTEIGTIIVPISVVLNSLS